MIKKDIKADLILSMNLESFYVTESMIQTAIKIQAVRLITLSLLDGSLRQKSEYRRSVGLEHLLFEQRKCKICGQTKELINDFYKTRKDRGNVPSAYAYECKRCSIKRVSNGRKKIEKLEIYPDWQCSRHVSPYEGVAIYK